MCGRTAVHSCRRLSIAYIPRRPGLVLKPAMVRVIGLGGPWVDFETSDERTEMDEGFTARKTTRLTSVYHGNVFETFPIGTVHPPRWL